MSKKVFNVFSILCFALVLCFIGCTELINPKTETDINLNIDLSKIIKSTRNTGETQSSASIGDNPTIKVAIYDAKKYNATTNSTDDLDLITEAQAKIVKNEAKVKLNNIPVGIDAIVFAELSFSNGNSTEVMYAGNSKVFRVEPTDNKISLVLIKVGNSESYPDATNTPYEKFTLFQKNSDGTEVNVTGASIETSSTAATKVTVDNPASSESVWTYFVKPENKSKFIEDANYKVSVELKACENETTVVGIAAARADYFFTVNSDWTTCEFETGYVKGSTDYDFTIGLGLSSEIEIRNLKIEKLETTGTSEPSLVFDISKDAINSYLKQENRPEKIVDVTKEATNGSYDITINTPMCHSTGNSTGNSTGTDDSYIQDVKLHLRSYATENTGANKVSFNITNNSNDFETSVMADTASDKSTAWNNNATKISENNGGNFSVDFPNYKANDELTVGLITSSTSINNSTSFKLSNFKVENAGPSPFSDKIFVYKTNANDTNGDIFTKLEDSSTISINSYSQINFDVLMFNKDVWNDTTSTINNEEKAWKEATRFFYTDDNISSELTYAEENDDSGNPKFKITNNSNEEKTVKISLNENYEVVIEEVPQVTYAEGLTCDVQDDTVTLYISNADGLAKFRDIVNGTLTEDISVRYNDNSTSKHDFSANSPQLNINAELENDIDLNNELWTPIGKSSTDGYKGTFDGAKHEIKGLKINSSDTNNPQGLFCSVYGGTVKNLVVQGSIISSYHTGGITGYLNGGTIENCVNNVEITNSATNGTTGGIVGYVENSIATIKNCVNMANVKSTQSSTVGGIVGATGVISETSNVSISKCINMGEISALSIVAGILGLANPITIENCINLGKVISTNEEFSYTAGIVIPSGDVSVTVTNCINAGNVVTNNGSVGAISTSTNGTYTNNYYDSNVNSSVVDGSNTNGITGISTNNLIGSNISLNGISTDDWTFAEGRYPLPNIAGNIPGDENGEMWNDVLKAATPDSSSVSGGGIDGTYVSKAEELKSALEDASVKTILINADISIDSTINITRDITIAANNDFTITQNVTDYEMINVAEDVNFVLGGGSGTLTIMGNSSLTKNIIYSKGNVTLKDKLVINNSYASNGVIFIYAGSLKMEGGEISNNQSNAITSSMGDSDVTIDIYGGKIYNNTKDNQNYGSAIYIISSNYNNATVNIYGKAQIYNNDNPSGAAIRLNDADSVLYINSSDSENKAEIYDNTNTNIQIDAGQLFINNTEIDLLNYTDSNIY